MRTQLTKPFITASLLAAVILGLTGCVTSPNGTAPSPSSSPALSDAVQSVSYLYEVQAPSGTVSNLIQSETQNETFTLTLDALTGAADVVTRFSDRPYREASTLTPDELTEQWSTLFASSSPNAILSYLEPGSALPQSIVVTLTKPVHDHNTGSLSFTATRIFREDPTQATEANFSKPATPAQFTSASLFIDGSSSVSLSTEVPGLVIDITVSTTPNGTQITTACGVSTPDWPTSNQVWATGQTVYESRCSNDDYALTVIYRTNTTILQYGNTYCNITFDGELFNGAGGSTQSWSQNVGLMPC